MDYEISELETSPEIQVNDPLIQESDDASDQVEQSNDQSHQQQPTDKSIDQPPQEPDQESNKEAQDIDYWAQVQAGNFGLVLQIFPQDFQQLDSNGYAIIHYAITYNNVEALKVLLGMGFEVDLRSRVGQTPLTIACNFGFIECAKVLLTQKANINAVDSYNFTPLLYALKCGHRALVLWLLCEGAEVSALVDSNGCSAVHWASYSNNVFMLRLIKAIGIEIDLLDRQGHTPLARACHNYAYGAIKFLINTYPQMMYHDMSFGTSRTIASMIRTQKKKNEIHPRINQLKQKIDENWNVLLSTLFLIINAIIISSFCSSNIFAQQSQSQIGFIVNVIYMIGLFYFGLCGVWFINRTTSLPDQGTNIRQRKIKQQIADQQIIVEEQKQDDAAALIIEPVSRLPRFIWYEQNLTPNFLIGITIKDFLSISYKPVEHFIETMKNIPCSYIPFSHKINDHREEMNEIMEMVDPLWYQGFTIIHLVYFLFSTNRFAALHNIDWNRVCPTCLIYKSPRMFHCVRSGKCVDDYHSYSTVFRKVINSTNHLFYFGFITLQLVVYAFYVFLVWYNYVGMCISRQQ